MVVEVKPHEVFKGIYWAHLEDGSKRLATKNLAPGRNVYGERLIKYKKEEYRIFDPYRSKLAASILNGIKEIIAKESVKMLYLGASTGTTVSHVSDIIGENGIVYCIEFAPRVMRELVNNVCSYRRNTVPILADARFPLSYKLIVGEVDAIYCDIAQPEQAKILADNADLFLRPNGEVMIALKARSIDVTKAPSEVFERELDTLTERGFKVKEKVNLEPYDRDHIMVLAEYKP